VILPCDLLLNVGAQFKPRYIYVYLGQLHATKDHLKKITNLAVGVGGYVVGGEVLDDNVPTRPPELRRDLLVLLEKKSLRRQGWLDRLSVSIYFARAYGD
jgi:hypothetical protein